jgi:ubiquitin-like-conjugating enzyme ATG10
MRYSEPHRPCPCKTDTSQAALKKPPAPQVPYVTYEVHFHPTYRMPCLWFSLKGLPSDEPAFNIDTVFRRLVPDQFKDSLRGLGGIGGISGDVSQ